MEQSATCVQEQRHQPPDNISVRTICMYVHMYVCIYMEASKYYMYVCMYVASDGALSYTWSRAKASTARQYYCTYYMYLCMYVTYSHVCTHVCVYILQADTHGCGYYLSSIWHKAHTHTHTNHIKTHLYIRVPKRKHQAACMHTCICTKARSCRQQTYGMPYIPKTTVFERSIVMNMCI
jgi:hypothetical protein